jgi:hypothetical protein
LPKEAKEKKRGKQYVSGQDILMKLMRLQALPPFENHVPILIHCFHNNEILI